MTFPLFIMSKHDVLALCTHIHATIESNATERNIRAGDFNYHVVNAGQCCKNVSVAPVEEQVIFSSTHLVLAYSINSVTGFPPWCSEKLLLIIFA